MISGPSFKGKTSRFWACCITGSTIFHPPCFPGSVFGSKDFFYGLAIFFDTYSNHNGEHQVSLNCNFITFAHILVHITPIFNGRTTPRMILSSLVIIDMEHYKRKARRHCLLL